MRAHAALLALACALAGCSTAPVRPDYGAEDAGALPDAVPWTGRNVTLSARLLDPTGAPVDGALVVAALHLRARTGACGGGVDLAWRTWTLREAGNGSYGPLVVPEVGGDDAAFRVSARASGDRTASESAPARSASDTVEVTLVARRAAELVVEAPEGALVAWLPEGAAASERGGFAVVGAEPFRATLPERPLRVVVAGDGREPVAARADLDAGAPAVVRVDALAEAPDAPLAGNATGGAAVVVALSADGALVGAARVRDGRFALHAAAPGAAAVEAWTARGARGPPEAVPPTGDVDVRAPC